MLNRFYLSAFLILSYRGMTDGIEDKWGTIAYNWITIHWASFQLEIRIGERAESHKPLLFPTAGEEVQLIEIDWVSSVLENRNGGIDEFQKPGT